EAKIAHPADHQESQHTHDAQPYQPVTPVVHRIFRPVDHRTNQSRCGRNRQPHKVPAVALRPVGLDVEASQSRGAANHESKSHYPAQVAQVLHQLRSGDLFYGSDTPGKGQESRSHSKADHVRERILLPARTWSPTVTCNSTAGPTSTSTREPNLISPTRSPRSSLSPGRFQNTIRRASKPAICFTITVPCSPSIVKTFCSFSSEARFWEAIRKAPLR